MSWLHQSGATDSPQGTETPAHQGQGKARQVRSAYIVKKVVCVTGYRYC